MALTNSQYDYFMRIYEKRQLNNEARLRARFEEVYQEVPRLRTLDHSISELSVRQAHKLLDGDSAALTILRNDLHLLFEEKRLLLEQAGYPENYLELTYHCPDCQDTGYIGKSKCHCFKKAITRLREEPRERLWRPQSGLVRSLPEILERIFGTFCFMEIRG